MRHLTDSANVLERRTALVLRHAENKLQNHGPELAKRFAEGRENQRTNVEDRFSAETPRYN